MIRKTLTILSLIGLLLSVGLWGASYFDLDYAPRSLIHKFLLYRGAFHFRRITGQIPDDWRTSARRSIAIGGEPAQQQGGSIETNGVLVQDIMYFCPGMAVGGFKSLETLWSPKCGTLSIRSIQILSIRIPLWIPTAVFVATTWLGLAPFHRRRKRKKLGLCVKCGYDLRASKKRCPECGSPFQES